MEDSRTCLVLLLGGPSGIGKTTIAAQVARRLGWSWLMVDDLRLALVRSGVPIPDSSLVDAIDAPGGLISVGEAMAPAIEVVIENHVDQRYPVVIEGDGILPSLFERPSVQTRTTDGLTRRVRAVFLSEPDEEALYANLIARGADHWRENLRAYARKSARFGEWLSREAAQCSLPVVSARPWDTLVERILSAATLQPHDQAKDQPLSAPTDG